MTPRLSIVLIDWSARESFHILKYLSQQNQPRSSYEVIWIEFYGSRAALSHDADKFIVLDMPKTVYYHKHFMYNVGIVHARGEIVLFCDSDAIVKESFVKSVLDVFDARANIFVHLDQVRNHDHKFYPFNYPSIEALLGKGSNWRNGSTLGMRDNDDPLHRRNYGACMAAKKTDLIRIGGADEHLDYLGYICGPYDMSFRLRNAGVEEVWHPTEFIYHVWHPNEGGAQNREGPHDGRKMSSRALSNMDSKRIRPFVENPMIRDGWNPLVISEEKIAQWTL